MKEEAKRKLRKRIVQMHYRHPDATIAQLGEMLGESKWTVRRVLTEHYAEVMK